MKSIQQQVITALGKGSFYFLDGELCYRAYQSDVQEKAERWLAKNLQEILDVILNLTGIDCYKYIGFNTGFYGLHNSDGVTLSFEHVSSESDAYCIFNACITYERGPKAGNKLPKKKFKVGRRTKLRAFLRLCRLEPRRESEYHEHMGKLKSKLFEAKVASTRNGNKLDKDTLIPLNVSENELRESLSALIEISVNDRHYFDNFSALPRQAASATDVSDLRYDGALVKENVRANSTALISRKEVRKHGSLVSAASTHDYWLSEYSKELKVSRYK
ncbi:hypothetical protein [Marinobacterium sp. xm-g-59]|uniref:hypothetical protein n=1 Tax=Marinobacterium sp. xm-g-59 TaxID=2497748 RepID=UPI001568789F|nr:hypothetical protein [Marinobacterium sp. xm-g-59]